MTRITEEDAVKAMIIIKQLASEAKREGGLAAELHLGSAVIDEIVALDAAICANNCAEGGAKTC